MKIRDFLAGINGALCGRGRFYNDGIPVCPLAQAARKHGYVPDQDDVTENNNNIEIWPERYADKFHLGVRTLVRFAAEWDRLTADVIYPSNDALSRALYAAEEVEARETP